VQRRRNFASAEGANLKVFFLLRGIFIEQ